MLRLQATLIALALLVATAACGADPEEPPPPAPTETATEGGEDSLGAVDPVGEPHVDEPERCYATEVNGTEGCWASAAEACEAGGCPADDCECTEATSNNTCGC